MILDLLYPPTCLHCKEPLEKKGHFCSHCLEEFTLERVEGKCAKCFGEIPQLRGTCKTCRKKAHPYRRYGYCFEAYGPAKSLVNAFLKGKHSYLAKELAAYLVVQLEALNYPSFDLITTVPKPFSRSHNLVGKELSLMLGIPFKPVLKLRLLTDPPLVVKKKCTIINQNVLLFEINAHTLNEVRSACQALQNGWCESAYGIAFCGT